MVSGISRTLTVVPFKTACLLQLWVVCPLPTVAPTLYNSNGSKLYSIDTNLFRVEHSYNIPLPAGMGNLQKRCAARSTSRGGGDFNIKNCPDMCIRDLKMDPF